MAVISDIFDIQNGTSYDFCMSQEFHSDMTDVLGLIKGPVERYVFLYNEQTAVRCLYILGRFAADPELSFTWHDAARLSQKIRQEVAETCDDEWIEEQDPILALQEFPF